MELLIASLLLAFLTFGMLDYYVFLSKYQHAEHIMHKYLQRISVDGFLTVADEQELRAEFQAIGCPVEEIFAPRESVGDKPVLRDVADVDKSTITLTIVARPEPAPLWSGLLIGGEKPDAGFRIKVGGKILSERVEPELPPSP